MGDVTYIFKDTFLPFPLCLSDVAFYKSSMSSIHSICSIRLNFRLNVTENYEFETNVGHFGHFSFLPLLTPHNDGG